MRDSMTRGRSRSSVCDSITPYRVLAVNDIENLAAELRIKIVSVYQTIVVAVVLVAQEFLRGFPARRDRLHRYPSASKWVANECISYSTTGTTVGQATDFD